MAMDSLSHNPAAGDIGSQLVDIGSQGISAASTAAMSVLSGLIPAGGEEVSAQAVLAFAQEAATMLASNTAAQEELMRTGSALTDIARMYGESDDVAAGALAFSSTPMSRLASMGGLSGGAGVASAAALQSPLSAAAGSPVVAGLTEAASSPMTSAVASAGSSAISGAAPMGSGMGAGAPAGGASKAGLASANGPADDQDDSRREGAEDPGERLL